LDAKETLESGGWCVVHGIVDSLWVQPVESADQTPTPELRERITAGFAIPLELEDEFEWVCFVPKRDSRVGALKKYFGKVAGQDEYVTKGIEAVQRSTPPFVETLQRSLIRTLDETRSPAVVCDRLHRGIRRLQRGDVAPEKFLIRKRVSKSFDAYDQRTQTVASLRRANEQGLSRQPGQDVEYIVVDDSRRSSARARLAYESLAEYDSGFYTELAMRAGETILSPLNWDRNRIERYLRGTTTQSLKSYR
jgi:DNA polymerase I